MAPRPYAPRPYAPRPARKPSSSGAPTQFKFVPLDTARFQTPRSPPSILVPLNSVSIPRKYKRKKPANKPANKLSSLAVKEEPKEIDIGWLQVGPEEASGKLKHRVLPASTSATPNPEDVNDIKRAFRPTKTTKAVPVRTAYSNKRHLSIDDTEDASGPIKRFRSSAFTASPAADNGNGKEVSPFLFQLVPARWEKRRFPDDSFSECSRHSTEIETYSTSSSSASSSADYSPYQQLSDFGPPSESQSPSPEGDEDETTFAPRSKSFFAIVLNPT